MSAGTIIILPGGAEEFRSTLMSAIFDLGGIAFLIDIPAVSAAPMSVLICAQLHELDPLGPLVVLAPASSVDFLPAVALAQRAAHRRVAAYYLIDPHTDPTGPEWPDAPVYLIQLTGTTISRLPELRGWQEIRANGIDELAAVLVSNADS
ncbi:MAG: hypothetical protein F2675_06005 [Actinobacteria bacterium]|uniref:Unannotated protein n=1 Tax=freshwater metagenome TaxID=449393 RepID=A0A6J6QU93_9ZZZZ|nr:hypothetical protein [Actinomycetota bacterium]